jgi:nucleotidyltransferase substrate binding protein (TIGR01987 family)
MIMSEKIYIEPLIRAFDKFERFRPNDKSEQERAGIVQGFKWCFELCWKIMKRLLDERGQTANSPKETFRMAALEGFIADPEIWFDFLKKRNMTVHTYNPNQADAVIAICSLFSDHVKAFLCNIGEKHDS